MDVEEFQRDKRIDPEALDVECARQAEVFFRWSEEYIAAQGKAERLKLKLDTVEARMNIACREKPEEFGLTKTTEAAISAAVVVDARYQKAYVGWLRAKGMAELLKQAVRAMEQKKSMLQELVVLHGQQYFAGPSVPRNLAEAWKEQQMTRENRVGVEQKKRTRQAKRKGGG